MVVPNSFRKDFKRRILWLQKMKSIFIKLILISAFSIFSVIALAQEDQAEEKIELSPTPLIDQAVTNDIEAEESWAEDSLALSADEVTKALAQSGGVHCINTVGGFVDPTNPDIVSTDIIFKHIDHIVNLVGIDHVGYGSDFIPDVYVTSESGQTPLADAIFPDPRGGHMFQDMCEKGVPTPAPYQFIAPLVDKMLEHGYSNEDCGKVIGGNVYRVFKQVWK